jgi:acyl-CoA synthetase (AMP-forming)/AMP-acid ligase II
MGVSIFSHAVTRARLSAGARVQIGDAAASWSEIMLRGSQLRPLLPPGSTCIVDPTAGLDAFVALSAAAMTDDIAVIWAKPSEVPLAGTSVAPGLFLCADLSSRSGKRPVYATVTSGSVGKPKMAVAFADALELVALQYTLALYGHAFPDRREIRTLATCLPLDYAATFMMAVVPALMGGHSLVAFQPNRWSTLHAVASREPVACIAVPSLLAAAAVSTLEPIDMRNLALLITAGYLSRSRIDAIGKTFKGVRLLTSYGATETGVMTIDHSPDGEHFHVGRPIVGKPVWLVDVDAQGVGKIATAGPDCREFYWEGGRPLRNGDGSVIATDYGHFDEVGHLYLDGRIDGGTKLHGITIYPRTLERHVLTMPGVVDARASIAYTATIDRLELLVVGSIEAAEVQEFCGQLPEIYRPAVVRCAAEGADAYTDRGKLNPQRGG